MQSYIFTKAGETQGKRTLWVQLVQIARDIIYKYIFNLAKYNLAHCEIVEKSIICQWAVGHLTIEINLNTVKLKSLAIKSTVSNLIKLGKQPKYFISRRVNYNIISG